MQHNATRPSGSTDDLYEEQRRRIDSYRSEGGPPPAEVTAVAVGAPLLGLATWVLGIWLGHKWVRASKCERR
jgi:hypothetical protein